MSNFPHIRVERQGSSARLLIDGEDFPWPIAWDGIDVNVNPDNIPGVSVTILADRVEVVDALQAPDEGEPAP